MKNTNEEIKRVKLQVDWYTDNGKWKYGGEVQVDVEEISDRYWVAKQIVQNQNEIRDGWQGSYFVTAYSLDPDVWYDMLFMPWEFARVKR